MREDKVHRDDWICRQMEAGMGGAPKPDAHCMLPPGNLSKRNVKMVSSRYSDFPLQLIVIPIMATH